MKYYAVIDTNVLVSAMLKWNSVPGNVMELVFDGPIIPVYNPEILREYREVLSRPKFHLPQEIVNDVLENFENRGISIEAETLDIILPDPKDRVFYEVVLEERKTEEAYLVTGNIKHFPIETYIVTPRKINAYKSASSRLLKKEFPLIRQKLWKEYFWSQSFCLLTTGGAPVEVIRKYIESQGEKH